MSNRRMPLRLAVLLAFVAVLALMGQPLSSQGQPGGRPMLTTWIEGREAIAGEVIVRYRSEAGPIQRQRAEFQAAADDVEPIGHRGARRMRSDTLSTPELLQVLRANPDVEFVEPNYIIRVGAVPNDTWFPLLWGLLNTGQTIGGSTGIAGADISAVEAWSLTTGSHSTVIGVVDTGIDYNHPDLSANIWSAPHAFSVNVGGVVITCAAGTHGFNAINNTCNPLDDHSHGTHVAGTIGAVGNNGVGVVGVNWTASMMGLKFLDSRGSGTLANAIKALEFAIQAKAALGAGANLRVLNNSWGGGGFSLALQNQIAATNAQDMLFVAAAGNASSNNDSLPFYPASYTTPNVVSVAASTNRDQHASFSNYGAVSVDLHAPGHNILSTVLNKGYQYYSGTSMAAPHVSGAAALMLAACPRTTDQLKTALLATVDPVGSFNGLTATAGRLNVNALLATCDAVLPALTINNVSLTEGNAGSSLATFTVSLSAASAQTVTVGYATANGTASAPGDYVAASGGLSFSPGVTTQTISIAINGDTLVEPNETFSVLLSNPVNAAITDGQGVGTIVNDDVPALTINDVTITEGNAGTSNATFTVSLSAPTAQTVTVGYATANGSASAPSDYVAASGVLNFAPGVMTQTITVAVNGDTLVEPNETFAVLLSNPVNAAIADGQGVGTIINDDLPALTINDVTITEGHAGSSNATFTVSLSAASAQTVTVGYATADGTASAPGDYVAASAMLNFAPGVTTQTIPIAVNGDTLPEANETFAVLLSNPVNAAIADGQGVATITNDDVAALTINDVTITEGHAGSSNATFTVSLSAASAQTVTVGYVTADRTASAASDYVAASSVVSFSPGVTTQTISIAVNGDTLVEPNETFAVLLSNPVNAAIADGQGVATIMNDDVPALTINDVTITESHAGSSNATFTVSLSAASAQTVTVGYATSNGTASAPGDYVAASGTLNFAPGVTTQTIPIAVNGDTLVEPNETFAVLLSNPVNAAIADGQGVATITNDDLPTLRINDIIFGEGNVGSKTVTFTVTLSAPSPVTVTVGYATANGSATVAGGDYVQATGTLSFAPGVTTGTISVTVNGDTTLEGSETFFVNLSNATSALIADAQGVATIGNDDGRAGS